MVKKLKGTIEKIIEESEDVKSFWIKLEEDFAFTPGQFVIVSLPDLEKKGAFSIGSSPTEHKNKILITVKKVGLLTGKLHEAKLGDIINIIGPLGDFTFKEQNNDLVLIAGGCGIVPFRSIIHYVLDKKLKNKVVLLYSARTEKDIIYRYEWEKLKNKNIKIVITLTRQQWEGRTGRIDKQLIEDSARNLKNPEFFVCGPQQLVEEISEKIKQAGYNRIRIDKWR
ncbi:MAG: FAD-dependent oxidoreductase [Candidatus Woesearchaeota archaeon]